MAGKSERSSQLSMRRCSAVITFIMIVIVVMMAMVMAVFMIMVVAVVFASFGGSGQPAGQIERNEDINMGIYLPGMNRDAVQGKVVERTLADSAGDDHAHALFTQPARKRAGLMWRRRKYLLADHGQILGIRVHERKLAAAAEMAVQSSISGRDGDANGVCFGHGGSYGGCHIVVENLVC